MKYTPVFKIKHFACDRDFFVYLLTRKIRNERIKHFSNHFMFYTLTFLFFKKNEILKINIFVFQKHCFFFTVTIMSILGIFYDASSFVTRNNPICSHLDMFPSYNSTFSDHVAFGVPWYLGCIYL